MNEEAHHYCVFETAGGFCGIAWSGRGITRFQLPTKTAAMTERLLLRRLFKGEPHASPPRVQETITAVRRYFDGSETDFSAVDLDLEGQDAFFVKVYAAARQIPWGHTTTYGALAKALGGGPETARDVGLAMAGNPVALIIPCHRVLAAGGKIGGFSAPGGVSAKLRMLQLEGVHLNAPEPAQRSLAF
ncbi:methylated-DNA--[protein]-cysteine S-methyltransferase [Ensifer sp. NBAIM29]|nr:methylated-DNA--[protein]-cysteine S-methyltransferase [Ensifer sp. NBAIM29]